MKKSLLAAFIVMVGMVTVWYASSWKILEQATIKVGILHSLTGTMAESETPVVEATLLAIEKINANGGLLGRKLEPVIADGKSNDDVFAQEAERLIRDEHVSVIFGTWTSSSRKSVKPILEKYNQLLFYPVQSEGLEISANIIYTGSVPNQQISPALNWALEHLGSKAYLVGSDYIFPRVANWLIGKETLALLGDVVGERYLPLGSHDMQAVIADIQRLKPDFIMSTINGSSNQAFFHALKEAGMSAENMPVMSLSLDAQLLSRMPHDEVMGHFAAWRYFQSIDSEANRSFTKLYQQKYGVDVVLSDPMEAAWTGVMLWGQAVQSVRSLDATVVRERIRHESILAPAGVVSIDHDSLHAWGMARIARVNKQGEFAIVWQSDTAIRPVPYPSWISREEVNAYLQNVYLGWEKHWSAPAAIEAVDE